MSVDLSGEITAIATAVLAAFAIVTAWYARRAFLKLSQEVGAIEQQVRDAQELARQQAELLRIQSGQLELQRQQSDEQHAAIEDQIRANARQAEVAELQTEELRESLAERNRALEEQRRSQPSKLTAWFGAYSPREMDVVAAVPTGVSLGAIIRNASDLPVLDIRAFFYYVDEAQPGAQWQPVMRGGPVERIRLFPPALGRIHPDAGQTAQHLRQCQHQRVDLPSKHRVH